MPDLFVAPEAISSPSAPDVSLPPEPKGHSFSAYIAYPENMRFDTQEEAEQILLVLRQHWITNVPWIFVSAVLFLAPTFLLPLILRSGSLSFLPGNFLMVLTMCWYLFSFGLTLVNFITWYFNVYIVTNERVIDVDFFQLLYKQMASARVSRIQDITFKLGGVMRSIFDYGDVFVQTAGELPNFDFIAVPHPEQVVKIIENLTQTGEQPI